jgi:septal ring-binding cell division protein DamX
VSDPIHDQAEDGFHEIQLSGKQLVFLFMLTTVVLVVTFLSGVLVGRAVGTEDRVPDETVIATGEPDDAIDLSEPTPPQPLGAHDDLKRENASGIKAPDPTPPPPDPVPEAPVPEQKPEREQTPESKPEPKVEPQKPPSRPAAGVPTSGQPGTWFLQVSALSTRSAAADMVRSLNGKGYPAYLQEPQGDALYRVRIGRYRDRAEADRVAARLKRQENFAADVRRN